MDGRAFDKAIFAELFRVFSCLGVACLLALGAAITFFVLWLVK